MQFGGITQFGGAAQFGGAEPRWMTEYRILKDLRPPGAYSDSDESISAAFVRAESKFMGDHARLLVERSEEECFPHLTEELITEWEALLNVAPASGATLDERRAVVLAKWRGGVSMAPLDLRALLDGVLGICTIMENSVEDVTANPDQIYAASVYRDPTDPGSYDIANAQRICDTAKPAHTLIMVGESIDFLTDDPFSLTDRDILGA